MLEAKLNAIREVLVHEVPELAEPREDWALVKTGAVGICGSEMHVYLGVNPVLSPPRVQGHEFSGTVKSINGASDFKPGDRVTVNPVVGCNNCQHCNTGFTYRCDRAYVIGGEVSGAFGGEVYVPIRNLVSIPDSMSMVDATLVEPASVAVHTVGDLANKTVLIIGQGAIGLLCLQVAKMQGNTVIAMDVSDEMLAASKKLGADFTVNSKTQDAAGEIKAYLNGKPLDAVIDAVCNPDTANFSVENVKKGGMIMWVGIPKAAFTFDLVTLLCKEIKLHTSYLYSEEDFRNALNLVASGKVDAGVIVSRTFPFEEAAEAFAYKLNTPSIKVVVENK